MFGFIAAMYNSLKGVVSYRARDMEIEAIVFAAANEWEPFLPFDVLSEIVLRRNAAVSAQNAIRYPSDGSMRSSPTAALNMPGTSTENARVG